MTPDENGTFWKFGGPFVPRNTKPILEDLDEAYSRVRLIEIFGVRLTTTINTMWGDHLLYILLKIIQRVKCQNLPKERGFKPYRSSQDNHTVAQAI